MSTRKIDLIKPLDYNGQTITHVMLREPTALELMTHGEPLIQSRSSDVIVEDGPVIAAYLQATIVEPAGLPLDRVSLADGMRLKDAVFDFFGDARRAGWATVPTVSSEISAGSTPPASAGQA